MSAVTTVDPEVKVGDFFECSWGYDQTNVDFYKVVGLTPSGKSVRVQKWSSADASSPTEGPSSTHVVAGSGPAMVADWSEVTPEMDFWERQAAVKHVPAPVMTKRLRVWGQPGHQMVSFSVNSYSSAYLWDGKPQYETASGFGH